MDQSAICLEDELPETPPDDRPKRVTRLRRLALPILATVLTLVAYSATLRFAFVYDDRSQIVANPTLHSWRYFTLYFTNHIWQYGHPEIVANYYRPLTQAWKLIHYMLFGLSPFWWHLSNILVHLSVTLLVFALARRLTGNMFVAGASAIIFGLHPAHIEDVAWVSGVTDPLLTLLIIASLLCYISGRRLDGRYLKPRSYLFVSVLLYGLATLTKVTAMVFPGLIFFYEYLFGDPDLSSSLDKRRHLRRFESAIKRSVPYLISTGIYLVVRVEVLRGFAHEATPVPVRTIILTAPSILWFYLKSLVCPVRLGPYYDVPLVSKPGLANFVLPLLGLCAAGLLVWWAARDLRLGLFLAAWMILPMIPVLNISVFSAGDIAHDRFLYLPSAGFSILVAAGLRRLRGRSPSLFGEPGLQVISVFAIACIFGVLTVNQEQFWQDDLALYSRGVASAPMNTAAANNLALALVEKGSARQALNLLQSAIARNPDHWVSSYNLGFLYYKLGNDEDAEKYLRRAVNLNPESSRANFFLGMVLLDSGHPDAAKWLLDRAIEIGPVQSGFYYGQGLVLERQGKTSEALDAYKKELSLSPGQAELAARIKAIEGQSPNQDEHGNNRESADRTADIAPHKELTK